MTRIEPRDNSPSPTALTNILVVELGSRAGAGACGSLLAQLGATVVFVETEAPDPADAARRAQRAAGKLSLVPGSAEDRDLVRDLIAVSDVVISSTDCDGALPLDQIAKRSVACDITAYGHSGAKRGHADSELQIQALTGIAETTGMGDGAPVPIPLPVVGFLTGVYAAAATVAALRVKAETGAGQAIDMSMYDCAFAAMATFLPRVLIGDSKPINRIGNRHIMIAPWNVFQAADGWILICVGNDSQWQRLGEAMGRPDLVSDPRFLRNPDRAAHTHAVDAIVQAWVRGRAAADCLTILNDIQIACGPVAPVEGYPREANLEFRDMVRRLADPVSGETLFAPASPLRMSLSPGRAPDRIPAPDADRDFIATLITRRREQAASLDPHHPLPRAALSGLRIVEIGHYTTVPLSTRVLASLGADVIKIEPPEGEATRDWPPTQHGQGYFFTLMNSDKRSLVLDLRSADDLTVLSNLLKTADVLIENLKPGALGRRGLSAQNLTALNPRLIYCAVSGFGSHSLYAGRPAYDTVIQAMSGLMDIVRAGGVPVKTGISSADLMGAEFAVLALLGALAYRDRTGKGQYIDLSMQDITAWMTQTAWNGAAHRDGAPRVVSCRDGFVLVEGAGLPKFGDSNKTAETSMLSRGGFVAQCESQNLRAAPILTVHELVNEPQTTSRGLWLQATEGGETWPLLESPMRLTGTPPAVRRPMPDLGRDSIKIREALGAQNWPAKPG